MEVIWRNGSVAHCTSRSTSCRTSRTRSSRLHTVLVEALVVVLVELEVVGCRRAGNGRS